MDILSSKTPKPTQQGVPMRTQKVYGSNFPYNYENSNKENILNFSNVERPRSKAEDKGTTYSNLGTSAERRGKVQRPGLQTYNKNYLGSPTYATSKNLFTSPKNVEIDLLADTKPPSTTKFVNNFIDNKEKREAKPIQNDNVGVAEYSKREKEENSSKSKSKDRKLLTREEHSSGRVPFEEKAPDKITIYTRLLSSMKPATPKTKDLQPQKPTYTSPKSLIRTSIDLLTLNNEARKAYVNGPTISGRLDKSNETSRKDKVIASQTLRAPLSGNRQEEARSVENRNELNKTDKYRRMEIESKQERPYRKDRFSLTKKLTIDINEPIESSVRDRSQNARENINDSKVGNSSSKVYESANFKRDIEKTSSFVTRSSAIDGPIYNNYTRTSKDIKPTNVKSTTPKANNMNNISNSNQTIEVKKILGSSKNFSGSINQARILEPSQQGKISAKKESTNTSIQEFLKSGGSKSKERARVEANGIRKRPPSLTKANKEKEINAQLEIKQQDEDLQIQGYSKKQEASIQNSLGSYVTQVNAGEI